VKLECLIDGGETHLEGEKILTPRGGQVEKGTNIGERAMTPERGTAAFWALFAKGEHAVIFPTLGKGENIGEITLSFSQRNN